MRDNQPVTQREWTAFHLMCDTSAVWPMSTPTSRLPLRPSGTEMAPSAIAESVGSVSVDRSHSLAPYAARRSGGR